jgi:L-asparaginase
MTVLLNLGGTIALAYVGDQPHDVGVHGLIDVPVVDIAPVQSQALGWNHLRSLREQLLTAYVRGERRFLVTVGTDALEEVAYFMSLVAPPEAGVVVVGALHPRSHPDSDGPASVTFAYEWLQQPDSSGVRVVCGERHLMGALVEKVCHADWVFRPYQSASNSLAPWRLDSHYRLARAVPDVPIVTVGVGAGWGLARMLAGSHSDGVVIAGYATGDVPPVMVTALQRLISSGIPVVLASRSRPGRVEPAFPGVAGTSADLLARGLWGAGTLDAVRVRIRLMTVLAARPRIPLATAFQAVE